MSNGHEDETAPTPVNSIDISKPVTDTSVIKPFSLPPELWIATLDFLRIRIDKNLGLSGLIGYHPPDTRTLKQLSLTSHSFYTLAQPFLFERIILRNGISPEGENRTSQLLEALNTRPERKSWVHQLGLDDWKFGSESRMESSSEVWNLILEFRNLRALRLKSVSFPMDIFEHLKSLHHFYYLSIRSCSFQYSDRSISLPEPLEVKSLTLRSGHGNISEVAGLCMGPKLESLRHGGSFAPSILSTLQSTPFSLLRTYHPINLSLPDIQTLFAVAANMPNLETLSFQALPPMPIGKSSMLAVMPKNVLPNLCHLTGPLWLLAKIVPDHPINHLVVHSLEGRIRSEDIEAFKSLGTGSGVITVLILEASAWVHFKYEDVGKMFPKVEELTLRNRANYTAEVRIVRVRNGIHY